MTDQPDSRSTGPTTPDSGERKVTFRDWVAVAGSVLGAFMAVLDIQITNSALKDIQGGIAASLDEGTWISTAYLVAEIIAIPLSAWMASVFSIRRYLMATTALFILFSVACGLSTNLTEIILFRAGQGFAGGALIPLALTIILQKLPPSKQPIGLALFGVSATFAPAIGPTIGGWLTDTWNWHYIFYVNVVPGLLLIWSVWYGINREPMRLDKLRHGDWFGIFSMAVGLGSMTAVLEEGERKNWFTTGWIEDLTIVALIFIPLFLIIEFTARDPFINLRLFARRGIASASLLGLILGAGLYGSVYLLPVYLTQIQGYDALQIGWVMMWAGLPQLPILPFVPRLMQRVDARWMVAFGFAVFGLSMLMNGYMSHDTGYTELRLPQFVRALGQPFIIVPLSAMATRSVERSQQSTASALFNVTRNLGGSIGISLISTFITIREQYHFSIISARVTRNGAIAQAQIAGAARRFAERTDLATAHSQSIATIANTVRREAYIMTFSDYFFTLGSVLLLGAIVVFLMPKPAQDGPVAAH